jgi:Putative peptidoglycan binding domain
MVRGRSVVAIVAVLLALGVMGSAVAVAASGGAGLGEGKKPPPSGATTPRPSAPKVGKGNPFGGRGMWIWEIGSTDHGSLSAIIAQAKHYGVSTLMIKSSDGTGMWSQFNRTLVSTLHASGLRVCAWQYVYGNNPVAEANVGAQAVRDGANCLLIDAESQYEGKYVSAQTYIQKLRSLIGSRFPVALAGFPYIDYHPGFPYSVFLGPGGAQYNAPQMYWKDIGVSVDTVYAHTFAYNRLYGRPIFPLGQVYNRPPANQIERFRQIGYSYGASGISWWDWQEAPGSAWSAISRRVGRISGYKPYNNYATLGTGANGDVVVWAQEHLLSAGERLTVDGGFGPATKAAVIAFQSAHHIAATGLIDQATWQALLRYTPAKVTWVIRRHKQTATVARKAFTVRSPGAPPSGVAVVPASAHDRAKGYEIPRSFGAGRP